MKTLGKKASVMLLVGILGVLGFVGMTTAYRVEEIRNFEELRELDRENYVQSYNQNILNGEIMGTTVSYGINTIVPLAQNNSFNIVGGNNRQTLHFYNVPKSLHGYNFVVSNNASSQTDINFAIYKLNSNGTLGSKIGGWYNDISAGNSVTKNVGLSLVGNQNFAVIIENDGWYWQNDIQVSGTVTAGY